MLTRLWKYAASDVVHSEYMMHAGVISMVEFDDDIFAAGNCYDQYQYKDYWLFCPYAYRLPEGPILAKDLAVEYKYLSNTSEWFYIARKNAEKVIKRNRSYARGKFQAFDVWLERFLYRRETPSRRHIAFLCPSFSNFQNILFIIYQRFLVFLP